MFLLWILVLIWALLGPIVVFGLVPRDCLGFIVLGIFQNNIEDDFFLGMCCECNDDILVVSFVLA